MEVPLANFLSSVSEKSELLIGIEAEEGVVGDDDNDVDVDDDNDDDDNDDDAATSVANDCRSTTVVSVEVSG